jgi:hypothetical protein
MGSAPGLDYPDSCTIVDTATEEWRSTIPRHYKVYDWTRRGNDGGNLATASADEERAIGTVNGGAATTLCW